jgi:RimJ/RimL family protein N-acetyltransferase
MKQYPAIVSDRLELVPLTPTVIRSILRGDTVRTGKLLQTAGPIVWNGSITLLEMRLKQMTRDRALIPWLLRAIVHRHDRVLIGHIGFHTGPEPQYLRELGLPGIEYGYTIFEPHRRQGYAKESAAALMRWARDTHGISDFVLSIAPTNEPSLRLAKGFGFTYQSLYTDPEDGVEHIYTGSYRGL